MDIRISNVKYSYTTGFTLDIDDFCPGAFTAIMGDNGSGKTTLGKILAGIIRPDTGCVLYNGEDIASWPLGKIGRHVGYLFQDPSRQLFAPTPLEEIAFPLELRGVSKAEAQEVALSLLSDFQLEHIKDSSTYTLSRGEKQRLAIGAVLSCDPKYLVLDEPTTGLDSQRKNILAATLRRLRSEGIGMLLITHDQDFVEELGANTCLMEGGRLINA